MADTLRRRACCSRRGLGAKATARLIGKAAELIKRADIAGAAAFYQIPEKTLERWYYEWVELEHQTQDESESTQPIRALGIDELSLKKNTANS